MEYLHTKRIVHFDLKSGNLLVGFREKSPICKVNIYKGMIESLVRSAIGC